jgi:type I restriction enzyme, R subunit
MITDINSEDRLVQKTFTDHLHDVLGWESVSAFNDAVLGPAGRFDRCGGRQGSPILFEKRLIWTT